MGGQIVFDNIPDALRIPLAYTEFSNAGAQTGVGQPQFNVLFIGQRLATGQVASGVVTQIFSAAHAQAAFGIGSQLASMIAAYKGAEQILPVYAIALDDLVGGVKATGSITFTVGETGVQQGTLPIWIAGTRIRVGVSPTDTPATIAANVIAAINALPALPVVASAGGAGVVNLTALHKGAFGNDIDLRTTYYTEDRVPVGLTGAVGAMAGGSGNPDITDALAMLGDTWYKAIVCGYNDTENLAALVGELTTLWGPLSQRDAVTWIGFRGDGSVGAAASFGQAQNSQCLTVCATGKSLTTPWEYAAINAGACCSSLSVMPVRPMQTLALPGFLPPAPADRFIWEERNNLLFDGISTYVVDQSGNVSIERQITTYQVNQLGAADTSYLNIETPYTLSLLRWSFNDRMQTLFPRCALANDPPDGSFNFPDGVVTPSLLKNATTTLAGEWAADGYVQNLAAFVQSMQLQIDPDNPNRVNMLLLPTLVSQFNILAAQIQFLF